MAVKTGMLLKTDPKCFKKVGERPRGWSHFWLISALSSSKKSVRSSGMVQFGGADSRQASAHIGESPDDLVGVNDLPAPPLLRNSERRLVDYLASPTRQQSGTDKYRGETEPTTHCGAGTFFSGTGVRVVSGVTVLQTSFAAARVFS